MSFPADEESLGWSGDKRPCDNRTNDLGQKIARAAKGGHLAEYGVGDVVRGNGVEGAEHAVESALVDHVRDDEEGGVSGQADGGEGQGSDDCAADDPRVARAEP